MAESQAEYNARIAERNRVETFMAQKLAERRAALIAKNMPIQPMSEAEKMNQQTMLNAQEWRTDMAPPGLVNLLRSLFAYPQQQPQQPQRR